MNEFERLKFVIVGHVDHGKSTLIGRLLYDTNSLKKEKIREVEQKSGELGRDTEFAFVMDSFKEEQDQGITIDTAQVFFQTAKRKYVIIDAPGHVEFVKNMVTGAAQAEAALLIIDAEEGVQQQTKRHAYILHLLGLKQVIVVVNKMDLVTYSQERFEEIRGEIQTFLKSVGVEPLMYIPISAKNGDNIVAVSTSLSWYDGLTVCDALDSLKCRKPITDKPLVFPVQDVYKISSKRITAGKIAEGKISAGQPIIVLPEGQKTVVKSVEKFLENVTACSAGESAGFTTNAPLFIERGNVVCSEDTKTAVRSTFKAHVFWLAKIEFEIDYKLLFRCATQESLCQIVKIEHKIDSSTLERIDGHAKKLKNLEVAEIVVKTDKPLVISTFNEIEELGRFVFEINGNLCAGGIIIDMAN